MNNESILKIQELDALAARRREEIRSTADMLSIAGTTYYVSNEGSDENDGTSPDTAWKTLSHLSTVELLPGDGVLFRRGDLFRGSIKAAAGVSYGAYGIGEKPRLYGWDFNLADAALWELSDAEHHIWRMTEKILDPGTLVFNDGEEHSYKLIPSYIRGRFVCRDDESRPFVMADEMERDLDIYWDFDEILTEKPSKGEDFPIPDMTLQSFGTLYLRCDRGNPGTVFSSIEALTRRAMFHSIGTDQPNVRIDNLCMKYIGLHAVASGGVSVKGLHVTNCEFGWIGGTIQHYFGTDPNYPEGVRGSVTRFGNAIEIYGGCEDYEVSNCYIYQVYDAGITHQVTTSGQHREMKKIRYLNNLVEKCVYGIEYFLDMTRGDTESFMDDVDMSGNILRESGYGWGQQRHNKHTPALIKGWSYVNRAQNYSVRNNIFDRSAFRMLHLVAKEDASCPVVEGNTYIQYKGGMLGQYGGNCKEEPPILLFDESIEHSVREVFGDKNAEIFVLE